MQPQTELTKNVLMKELRTLPIYRYHRHNLRPWDRKLPPLVAQEADNEQRWEMEPPSLLTIFGALFVSLAMYQLLWIMPFYVNQEHAAAAWKNIEIPQIIYNEPKVWMGLWIVTHLSSGLTLWFVWLTGGWIKHVPELLPIALAFFAECMWLDIAVYVARLDILTVLWMMIALCHVIAMYLLWAKKVAIGSIFLIPMLGASVAMSIYSAAFWIQDGHTYSWLGDIPRDPQAAPA